MPEQNATAAELKELLLQILQASGLMAAGALPVPVFLAVAVMLVPDLAEVMRPLGMLGIAGLGLRLLHADVRHPSQQELQASQPQQAAVASDALCAAAGHPGEPQDHGGGHAGELIAGATHSVTQHSRAP